MAVNWESLAQRVGPKIAKWLYGAYGQLPSLAAGASGGAAASSVPAVATASDVGLSAGTGASTAGTGTAGLGASGVASLLAPIIMTWAAYTSGSGHNDPLERRSETAGAAKLVKDLMSGQNPALNDYWSQYRLRPRYSEAGEEQAWTPTQLWHYMHSVGKGHKLNTGDSGFSDTDIDRGLASMGVDMAKLGQDLGFGDKFDAPDWEKESYDTWFARTQPIEASKNIILESGAQVPIETQQKDLTDDERLRRDALMGGASWLG